MPKCGNGGLFSVFTGEMPEKNLIIVAENYLRFIGGNAKMRVEKKRNSYW